MVETRRVVKAAKKAEAARVAAAKAANQQASSGKHGRGTVQQGASQSGKSQAGPASSQTKTSRIVGPTRTYSATAPHSFTASSSAGPSAAPTSSTHLLRGFSDYGALPGPVSGHHRGSSSSTMVSRLWYLKVCPAADLAIDSRRWLHLQPIHVSLLSRQHRRRCSPWPPHGRLAAERK